MPIKVTIDDKALQKQLKRFQKDYPFAISKAMQTTMQATQKKVRKHFMERIGRNRKGVGGRAGKYYPPRRGTITAVRARWPSKNQIRNGKGVARVFIIPPLVTAIHPIVFGGTIRATAQGNGAVVTPVHIRLNQFGNIPRNRLNKMRANKRKYLEIPLGNSNNRTKHLQPGIYEIIVNQARRSAPSRRRVNGRIRRRGSRIKVRNLLMMVKYERSRTYKSILDYHEVIEDCFQSRFARDLDRRIFVDRASRGFFS